MNAFSEILQGMNDPAMRHAALVHTPIALSVLSLPLLLALVLQRGRNLTLRWACAAAYALLTLSAYVTAQSGEAAQAGVGRLPRAAAMRLHDHEEMAEKVWLMAGGVVLCLAATWLHKAWAARAGLVLACLLGLFTAGWVAVAAHHGGTLVYEHGAGLARSAGDRADGPAESRPDEDPRLQHFRGVVQPLLEEHCTICHGAGRKIAGNLDFTSASSVFRGGDHGPGVAPGRPDESLLMRVVRGDDQEIPQMPLKADPLSEAQIEALRKWVQDGAVWAP